MQNCADRDGKAERASKVGRSANRDIIYDISFLRAWLGGYASGTANMQNIKNQNWIWLCNYQIQLNPFMVAQGQKFLFAPAQNYIPLLPLDSVASVSNSSLKTMLRWELENWESYVRFGQAFWFFLYNYEHCFLTSFKTNPQLVLTDALKDSFTFG